MQLPAVTRRLAGRLSLTQQVGLLSLIPIIALGFILAGVVQGRIETRTLADASQSAELIAHIGIQPRLSQRSLRDGLSASEVRALDQALNGRLVTRNLARIKIWNAHYKAVYSDHHAIIGRTLTPSDDLLHALAGRPPKARVMTAKPGNEQASEVGLGQLVEVYVPLRLDGSGLPDGAFEIYLHYAPIAAAVRRDKATIALVIFIGLAVLWTVLFPIVAGAARRLRRQSEENYRLAHYDQLTGLPNRTLFIERVSTALRAGEVERDVAALILVDLDDFKEINNTLGDLTGDRVLCEVARRLRDGLGEDTLLARLGGDEYAILAKGGGGKLAAQPAVGAVQSSLEAPIALDGVALSVEASIGVAVVAERAENPDTLLQRADAALARAKSHRSRVEFFSVEEDGFDPTRLMLLGQVRQALERSEFVLHYQPKINLQTRRIAGVEALLRWHHPQRGLLPPAKFIHLVEQTALVAPLTLHVIDRALDQVLAWRELGLHLGMSVNLSARNLLDPELAAQIQSLLREHGVAPTQLTVEVTESATMADPERAVTVLRALRAAGVGVAIDDFGTGNASIAYLTRLPASELKIDRSFVTPICEDERAQAIVRSTIEMARLLDLHVVAEGVESEAVLERLVGFGCDTAQGYFFSRPLPAEELTARLTTAFEDGGAELRPVSAHGPFVAARARP
jgi:diguanylate cyclase (GGDEF)-like protein